MLLAFPLGGVASYSLTIPNAQLAGLPLSHQFLQLELDAQSNLVSLSSSNSLSLVLGTF